MYKRLLTIQDVSCVGQCSATVALPIISVCGVECSMLPSAVLSNHTGGFDSWTFLDLTSEMPKIEAKWKELKLGFDAFYTGYVCAEQIAPILDIMRSCANPGAVRIVDPVMADNGKLYPGFAEDFPCEMAKLCNGADYVIPNLTEAALLVGEKPVLDGYNQAFIENLVAKLHEKLNAKHVILTGVSFQRELLGTAVSDGAKVEYDFNERLERSSHGTGDVFASAFAGAALRGASPLQSAAIAADFVCASISATPDEHWYGVAFEKVIAHLVNDLNHL